MMTIFQAIVIEAIPFVIFGCIVSSLLHIFLKPEKIKPMIPSNKNLAILLGGVLGFFFPSCECGIVPIITELLEKDIPEYVAIPFMLTAPIINPVVMFSTYIAFGNSLYFPILRAVGGLLISFLVGIWIAYFNKSIILKKRTCIEHSHNMKGLRYSFYEVVKHSINDFFSTSKYLIIGSLIASFMQVYIPTSVMLTINSYPVLSIFIMMLLAFTMSLCSEADAFVASSFLSIFGRGPIIAFMLFGPMVDIKNLMMMNKNLRINFYSRLIIIIILAISLYSSIV
ncbi:permease [Enterococcus gilvus]